MFKAETEARDYPSQTPNGEWKLHMASEQYRAWAYWLKAAFGKHWFPEPVMVVWFLWPPVTQEGANEIAAILSELRDGHYTPVGAKGPEKRAVGGKAVDRRPRPWNGYTPPSKPDDAEPAYDLTPWLNIMRDNGRQIPPSDSHMAQSLDALQKRPPHADAQQ